MGGKGASLWPAHGDVLVSTRNPRHNLYHGKLPSLGGGRGLRVGILAVCLFPSQWPRGETEDARMQVLSTPRRAPRNVEMARAGRWALGS